MGFLYRWSLGGRWLLPPVTIPLSSRFWSICRFFPVLLCLFFWFPPASLASVSCMSGLFVPVSHLLLRWMTGFASGAVLSSSDGGRRLFAPEDGGPLLWRWLVCLGFFLRWDLVVDVSSPEKVWPTEGREGLVAFWSGYMVNRRSTSPAACLEVVMTRRVF